MSRVSTALRGLAVVSAVAVAASVLVASPASAATPFLGPTFVANPATGGTPNGDSAIGTTSSDGRYIAFTSFASNLVPGGTNGRSNVFVRDTVAGTTTLVSVGVGGAPSNDNSYDTTISEDGRYVVFESAASDLVLGDTNTEDDLFLRDLTAGTTTRVSVSATGAQADDYSRSPSLSASGRFLVFTSAATNLVPGDTDDASDIFEKDLVTGAVTLVSVADNGALGNNSALDASVSADGHYVAFSTYADGLVPGGPSGSGNSFVANVYLRDTVARTTTWVSRGLNGTSASGGSPRISADGSVVVFGSGASNLVPGGHEWQV